MKPQNVNPKNFKVESILFENDEFSIAYGEWDGKYYAIGMRWNGEEDENPGYPKLFNNPVWFLIDVELKIPILKSLLQLEHSNNSLVLQVLEKEIK